MATPIWQWSAVDTAAAIRDGRATSEEVVQAHIDRMHTANPAINAIVVDLSAQAIEAARAADRALAQGATPGKLQGVPVTIKINIDLEGQANSNGVVAFKDNIAPGDSPVTANLKKAGAIIIGMTNTPEFSMRGFTDNPLHGPTLNPCRWGNIGSGFWCCHWSSGGWRAGSRPRSSDRRGNWDIRGSCEYTSTATGHLFRLPSLRISRLRAVWLWVPRPLGIPRFLRSSGLWIPRLFGSARFPRTTPALWIPRLLGTTSLPRLTEQWIPEPTAVLSLFRFRISRGRLNQQCLGASTGQRAAYDKFPPTRGSPGREPGFGAEFTLAQKPTLQNATSPSARLQIVYRGIDQLKPDPANPRRHSKKQVRQIADSIRVFNFNVPILIDRHGNVIAVNWLFSPSRSHTNVRSLVSENSPKPYPALGKKHILGGWQPRATTRTASIRLRPMAGKK